MANEGGTFVAYQDVWLLDGVRTPFVEYNTALGLVSPIDLGIKVARSLFARTQIAPKDVDSVIGGSVAQTSFDGFFLARHIGLYNIKEIAGGLWRNDYWAYNRKAEDGNPVFAYKSARG